MDKGLLEEAEIFECWNATMFRHRHPRLLSDIRDAIEYNLKKGWLVEDICGAIANYAKVLHSPDYSWTYGMWNLNQFLMRGKREEEGLRWVKWFHPNNFKEVLWLTDKGRMKRANKPKEITANCHKVISVEEEAAAQEKLAEAKAKVFDKRVEPAQMSEQEFDKRKKEQMERLGL